MAASFIKYLDYYSLNINLTYKGKEKYTTIGGGLLTIFSVLVVLLNAWLIGNDIYKKEKPTVISSDEDLGYTYPNYTISYDNFFLGYFFSNHENIPFDDETVLKVVPVYYTNNYDSNGTLIYNQTELEVVTCSDYFRQNNLQIPLSSEIMRPLKCINNLNHSLGGFWTVNYVKYIYFSIYTCRNETLKPGEKQCKSNEEIANTLSKLYFNLFYQSVLVNAKNYTYPMKTIISEDWFVMQPNLFKGIYYHFQNFVVKTDNGIIFNSNMDVKDTLGFQKTRQDYKIIENQDDNLIFIFEFYISNQNKIYQRSYITLQNIFANLGGIIQLLIIITRFFYNFYLNKKFEIKIMNNLYDFEIKNNTRTYIQSGSKIFKQEKPNEIPIYYKNKRNISIKNLSSSLTNLNKGHCFSINHDIQISKDELKNFKKKKIKFKSCDILSTVFCPKVFRTENIKYKDLLFKKALKDVNLSRDLMILIKNSQNFTKLKYLLLSSEQLLAFDYLEKPIKSTDGKLRNTVKAYADAFELSEFENIERIKAVANYFNKLSLENKLSEVDEKLLSIIDKNISSLIKFHPIIK